MKVYLDNNATTMMDPTVHKKLCDASLTYFANPSSVHRSGQEAKAQLVKARVAIASALGVAPQEIVFTATATEALNLVLRGYLSQYTSSHVITSNLEHAAVFQTLTALQAAGHDVTFLEGGMYGAVSPDAVKEAIRDNTKLICLMAANNETGVITDIEAIAAIAKARNIPFVVDAVAFFGKERCTIPEGVSAICFSGHKFHAPKGTGFMVIRKTFRLQPVITGGDQEGGRRAGTENLPAILALAEAVIQTQEVIQETSTRMRALRDLFEKELITRLTKTSVNGSGPRVSNTSNLCFEGVDGEALLMYLDMRGVEASLGSACASGALEPSRVLLNMGLTYKDAFASLRFTLSRYTTREEIHWAVDTIVEGVTAQRN